MTVHLSTYLHLDFIYKFGRGPDGINTDGVESRGKGRGLLYKGGGYNILGKAWLCEIPAECSVLISSRNIYKNKSCLFVISFSENNDTPMFSASNYLSFRPERNKNLSPDFISWRERRNP